MIAILIQEKLLDFYQVISNVSDYKLLKYAMITHIFFRWFHIPIQKEEDTMRDIIEN
jgi:hypothetical protein